MAYHVIVDKRKRTLLDGDTVPEVGAVLADKNGITWRVMSLDSSQAIVLRPNTGGWMTILRTPRLLAGWEVL